MRITTVKYVDGWSWAIEVNRRDPDWDGTKEKAALILSLGRLALILEFGSGEYADSWDNYI